MVGDGIMQKVSASGKTMPRNGALRQPTPQIMNKKRLVWSFLSGAILAIVLLHVLLASLAPPLPDTSPEAVGFTTLSVPFLEYTTPSGQIREIKGVWLWGIIALSGGMLWCAVTAIIRQTLKHARRR